MDFKSDLEGFDFEDKNFENTLNWKKKVLYKNFLISTLTY